VHSGRRGGAAPAGDLHLTAGARAAATVLAVLLAGLAPVRPAAAQIAAPEAPPTPRPPWRGSAELNGNVLFGAASQRLVGSTLGAARSDSVLGLRAEFQMAYGDAQDAQNVRRLVARTLRLAVGADRTPAAPWSPFVLGDVESNFQQRIALRASGGAGAKRTFWRPPVSDRGFVEDASLSLALLGERTRALDAIGGGAGRGAGTRVRWSLRARFRRRLAPAVRLSHLTLYQPTVNAPAARATAESVTMLSVDVRTGVALTATLRDRFDSEARRRGARSTHDGQVLFGLRASF
jgi:hypothetical protein